MREKESEREREREREREMRLFEGINKCFLVAPDLTRNR